MSVTGPSVVIEVGNRWGPQALEGLRLYNRLHEDSRPAREVEESWPRWFTENPFGSGVFAIARAGDRIVGFNSFIAVPMRLGGHSIPGGKGEFFAVEPEYRRAVDAESGVQVPVALLSTLQRRSPEFGVEALFAVPNPAAALVNLLAGRKPMPVDFVEHVTFFRRPRKPLHPHPVRNAVLGLGAVSTTTLQRGAFLTPGRGDVDAFERFEEIPLASDAVANLLVDERPEVLAHRFAGDRHWKFRLREPGRPPAAFVFSRFPDDVRLAWWSTLEVSESGFRQVLRRAVQRAKQDGVSNLRVSLPKADIPPAWDLGRWGFVRRDVRQTIFVHSANPELIAARTTLPWRFTNAHVGYY